MIRSLSRDDRVGEIRVGREALSEEIAQGRGYSGDRNRITHRVPPVLTRSRYFSRPLGAVRSAFVPLAGATAVRTSMRPMEISITGSIDNCGVGGDDEDASECGRRVSGRGTGGSSTFRIWPGGTSP